MQPSALLVAVLGAATVLAVAIGLLLPAFIRRQELARRLRSALGNGATAEDLGGRRRTRGSARARSKDHLILRVIGAQLEGAALDLSPSEILVAMAVLAILGGLVLGFLMGHAVAAVAGALGGALLPLAWVRARREHRRRAFRAQLADTVTLLAAAVRAGHSLLQALEQVSQEAPEPTASTFALAVREIGVGAAQEEALERLLRRYPSEDLDLIVTAINVQNQVGGSLAKVLDDIAAMLRERFRIEGDITALTAQQRYSAYVLALLPVFVAAALFLVSRDYLELLAQGMLRYAALAAALMVVAGFVLMRRIATIDV